MDPDAQRELITTLNARRGGSTIHVQLSNRDLTGVHAVAADLASAQLDGARLEVGCLAGACLTRANLEGANLRDTDLGGADLTEANLKYADLTGARLDDAIFTGADLRGACLADTLGDPLSMAAAKVDKTAIERSEFRMRDIAQLVIRGAEVNEKEGIPPRPTDSTPSPQKESSPPAEASAADAPLSTRQSAPKWDSGRSWLASLTPFLGSRRPPAPAQDAELPASSAPSAQDSDPSAQDQQDQNGPSGELSKPQSTGPQITSPERPSKELQELAAPPALDMHLSPPPDLRAEEDYPASTIDSTRQNVQNSILPAMRARELESRRQSANVDEELPASLRFFKAMDAMITEARPSLMPARASQPPRPPQEPIPDTSLAAFHMPSVGEEFLGVTLEEELTGSSVARTFRGKTADDRGAVVKVFDPEREGSDLQLPAFQRGVRALSRLQGLDSLQGLRVAEMLSISVDQLAYVTAYYENGSVKNIVDVAITMKGGLEVFETICESVAAMHREGVLVRALKPSNILIDGLTPLIGEVDMVDLPTLSQTADHVGGYASYVAPEERLGKGTRSPTADVYALGKMLEYLLTGEDPVVPLGSTPVIAQRKGTPAVLVAIVKRCLSPDPADRYQYVDDLLSDLHNFETRGASATLQASIRPGALSRLKAGPSLAPKRPEPPKKKKALEAPRPEQAQKPQRWISRRAEMLLGAMGTLLGLIGASVFYFAPSSVDAMENAEYALAAVAGFSVWLLPRPKERIVPLRIGAWAATAGLVLLLDPVRLSALSWSQDLDKSSLVTKENAIERLTRLGYRDFSERDLQEVSINHIDLGNANFQGANLAGADLSKSFLVEANFNGADVTGVKVFGANVRGASFENATGVRTISCNQQTKLSRHLSCFRGRLRIRNQ